jgi:ABC-type lipoprotein release transport system permease subunit
MTLIATGLVIGTALAFGAGRLLEGQLPGVDASDPLTFAGVTSGRTLVALAACYVPARHATQVNPVVTLRNE